MMTNIPDINSQIISDLINEHTTTLLPRYNRLQRIYEGKHDILNRPTTEGKPSNKLVLDFPGYITKIMTGYFLGKPVVYNSINDKTEEDEELLNSLTEIFRVNNEHKHNQEISQELSIKGEAFEILYINDDKEVEFVQIPAEEMIVKYEPSFKREMELALRHYTIKDITYNKDIIKVEVYTKDKIQFFTQLEENKFTLDKEIVHYFGGVPVIHYVNNKEKKGDWENIISLIDDLEKRLSDNSNELEAFREAYLKIVNMDMDPELLKQFKEMGAIIVGEGGEIDFLTKNVNDSFSEHHIERLIDLIHKLSMTPDLSDESFGGDLSGVAIKFKLYCIEQIASIKESNFKESLQRRIKLITNILNYLEFKKYSYRDIETTFTRNIPANLKEISDVALSLNGIVSSETLLAQIPFVTDVKEEIRRLEQDINRSVYPTFYNNREDD